jgi:hypothetical protein
LSAQQVVSTSGESLGNGSGSISYTIGEGVAQTLTQGDKTLTQGFQQSSISVSILNELTDIGYVISVFPNPVSDELNLKIDKESVDGMFFILYDNNGKQVLQKKVESPETTIPVSNMSSGIYVMKIFSGATELKSFKVIKK